MSPHRIAPLMCADRIRAKTVKKWRATMDLGYPYSVVPTRSIGSLPWRNPTELGGQHHVRLDN